MEKRKHVVVDTLCTNPDAISDVIKEMKTAIKQKITDKLLLSKLVAL